MHPSPFVREGLIGRKEKEMYTKLTEKDLTKLTHQWCVKVLATAGIRANRNLYHLLGGIVVSAEGNHASFRVGDVLAQTLLPQEEDTINVSLGLGEWQLAQGHYPIKKSIITKHYRNLESIKLKSGRYPNVEEVGWYLPTVVRDYTRPGFKFETNGQRGEKDDYLFWDRNILDTNPRQGMWVVPQKEFVSLYAPVIVPEHEPRDLAEVIQRPLSQSKNGASPNSQRNSSGLDAMIWQSYATWWIKNAAVLIYKLPQSLAHANKFTFRTNEGDIEIVDSQNFARENVVAYSSTLGRAWPIKKVTLERNYTNLGQTKTGLGEIWLPNDLRRAIKAPVPHVCHTNWGDQYGLAGYYVVYTDQEYWTVETGEFEMGYTPVKLSAIKL